MAWRLVDLQRTGVDYDVVADVELVVDVDDLRHGPLNAAQACAYPPVGRLWILLLLLGGEGPRRHYSLDMYEVLVCFGTELVDICGAILLCPGIAASRLLEAVGVILQILISYLIVDYPRLLRRGHICSLNSVSLPIS